MYNFKVITRIEEENERSVRFLHKSSHEKVTKLCQDVMVDAHKERLYAVCHEYIEGECMTGIFSFIYWIRLDYCRNPITGSFLIFFDFQIVSYSSLSNCFVYLKDKLAKYLSDWKYICFSTFLAVGVSCYYIRLSKVFLSKK